VETATGPFGQGLANSVGMAIAGRWQAAHFGCPGFEDLINFNVYALCGDGCMMEGISAEAASLAGHLKLANLCWAYDNNHVTHQPVEQVAALRGIPGLIVLRPADAAETVEAWRVVMQQHHVPAALVLTRQAVPVFDRTKYAPASGVGRGAYVLADAADRHPDVLLLGTGSEVVLCLEAFEKLRAEGVKARVVSMPSWELFDEQPQEYRDGVLPPAVRARVSVEQASTFGWSKYVGDTGQSIGMRSFGASAPLKQLARKFGFTVENVVEAAREQVRRARRGAGW